MGRAYLKLPFVVALIKFILKVRQIRLQQLMVHPQKQEQNFKSYKEKVLFIINSIRKQFGKRIYIS
jgi:hypothetical protein